MKKIIARVLLVTLLALALVSHTPGVLAESAPKKIQVVATIFPAYDFARAIAGDKADVTMLLRPGVEIHSFDPSPADILKVQSADAFLYIGGESDVWVDTLLSSMDTTGKTVLRLMDAVSLVEEETVEGMQEEEEEEAAGEAEEEAEYDEHIWTSPKNAALMMNAITEALCTADAANADAYRASAAAYITQIEALDKEFEAIVQSAPLKLMLFGDRFPFRYFADAYGLEYSAAFLGCSTDTECSAATLAYLIDTVKENKLPYIYAIELSSQNIARSIGEQTGAEILTMQSCQSISRDDFEAGETYVSLMQRNAEALKKGLMAP